MNVSEFVGKSPMESVGESSRDRGSLD
jgi:hypothetical protein